MSNIQKHPQEKAPGFWKRLLLAIEESSESYSEQLEKRVTRLETEVGHLSGFQKKPAKN